MNEQTPILIADNDTVASAETARVLTGYGYACVLAHSLDESSASLNAADVSGRGAIGVMLIEQDFDGSGGGLELIQQLRENRFALVPIVISGFGKVASAVRAMRYGAADYLLKPILEAELLDAVERAMQRHLLLADDTMATSTQEDDNALKAPPTHDTMQVTEQDAGAWSPMPLSQAIKGPERQILLAALQANGWNRQETARQLDINRTTLYKKIRQHRLDEPG